jgi:uncharacterized protein (TIGR00375 family)
MYIADLHIHSRYSRATSRDLTPEQLDFQARKKGIRLLGTGDFTHPAWREELKEKLIPAEDGLYRLREDCVLSPEAGAEEERTRFVVSGEISSIYKQDGKVRKVHSLILLPGLEEAEKLSARLQAIGNIHSDGRPILGLSCHDLLEIMLETCPEGMFIPAHIWTPHFSMFGALSGFDRAEECFGELTPYIHAVETGLSSDPPMNWQLSALDRFQLISNSDAHSPAKLGREANLLSGDLSYYGLKQAVETGEGLDGTIEFFPEEGKYHFDGHRKCHICLSPAEAEAQGGICPVCQKRLTMGVSHRIAQLADRPEGFVPEKAKPFESLVPLLEVIAASTGRSAAGKKVREEYETMIRKLGTEFAILREVPIEDIKRECGYLTAEGIRRLREGKVERLPGFDGEYGAVRLFTPDEIESPEGQMSMSGLFETKTDSEAGNGTAPDHEKHEREQSGEENFSAKALAGEPDKRADRPASRQIQPDRPADFLSLLNEKQREAAELPSSCLAVIAGPGTGKTGTLTARIKCLIEKRRVKPSEITAVTFTNQAAGELRERLKRELANKRGQSLIQTGTFHSICLKMLEAAGEKADLADPLELSALAEEILEEESKPLRPTEFLRRVSRKKTELALAQEMSEKTGEKEENSFQKAFDRYRTAMEAQGWLDFDDLLIRTVSLLRENCPAICRFCSHFRYLLVDEFQDISPLQYALIREWNKEGRELFVIGDPDQAIYGFRGSDAECFKRLLQDIPETKVIALQENYRSTEPIVKAACSVISHNPGGERTLAAKAGSGDPVRVVKAGGRRSEGIFTAREINRMIGGIDMLDAQERGTFLEKGPRSFSDIAVLCRTNRQAEEMEECLRTEGIPYIVTGRGTFLEADTVREAEGFFALLTEAGEGMEETAFKRTVQFLNRRIGGEKLLQLLEKYRPMAGKKPADLLKAWMGDRDLKEDEPLARLASMAMFHKTMKDFLFTLFWGREGDLKRCGKKRYAADAVSLMTLHASKGLEFPAVIIPGMRKGSLPLETEQAEEERRLFYVGMTRAREELILVTSGEPSPFLGELPEAEIQNEELAGTPEARARQMSLFDFFPSGEMPSA